MTTRRGLSSVVGMVFAIIVIASSVGYVTYSMNLLDKYNQAVLSRNQIAIDKGNENFQIYSAKISNSGKFNITIANTGNLPINITRMWVQNTTANDWVNFYTINKAVNPGSLLVNIGQSSPVGANAANAYNLKLVTSRGNTMQFTLGSPGVKPLFTQLMILPNYVKTLNNVTIIYYVTNNMTSNNLLTNLKPTLSCTAYGSNTLAQKYGPLPAQYSYLQNGGTAIFKWVYLVTGTTPGDRFACSANLGNSLTAASDVGYLQ